MKREFSEEEQARVDAIFEALQDGDFGVEFTEEHDRMVAELVVDGRVFGLPELAAASDDVEESIYRAAVTIGLESLASEVFGADTKPFDYEKEAERIRRREEARVAPLMSAFKEVVKEVGSAFSSNPSRDSDPAACRHDVATIGGVIDLDAERLRRAKVDAEANQWIEASHNRARCVATLCVSIISKFVWVGTEVPELRDDIGRAFGNDVPVDEMVRAALIETIMRWICSTPPSARWIVLGGARDAGVFDDPNCGLSEEAVATIEAMRT